MKMNTTEKKPFGLAWYSAPVLFFVGLLLLLATWLVMDPQALHHAFDQDGYSPFELATVPFYVAIVPAVWFFCPFTGSRRRRLVLRLAVSCVALMAVVKELDLHLAVMKKAYPEFVDKNGKVYGLVNVKNKAKAEKAALPVAAAPEAAKTAGAEVPAAVAPAAEGEQTPAAKKKDGAKFLTGTPFKMPVLRHPDVPFSAKALILLYFTAFFGVFGVTLAYFAKPFVKGVFARHPVAWSVGCFGASGVMVQLCDRMPAWCRHLTGAAKPKGDEVDSIGALFTALEEGGEMMIALFAIYAIVQSYVLIRRENANN